MKTELDKAKRNAEEARSKWESLRKERDFHKEGCGDTIKEKNKISEDIKTLQNLHENFQSKISDLKLKYEHLCKSKSLMKLEVEKLKIDIKLREQDKLKLQFEIEKSDNIAKKEIIDSNHHDKNKLNIPQQVRPGDKTAWPKDIRNNIYLLHKYNSFNANPSVSGKSIKAYEKSASCMSLHIKKHVVATGGDNGVFKIFNMATCQELDGEIGHDVIKIFI
jgi:hypothetical protein